MTKLTHYHHGFALPTVLIASIVMLFVLLVAVQAVTTTRTALQNQYYNQLALEAAEAGIVKAEACLKQNEWISTWTDAKPLTASTDCFGNIVSTCSAGCYILNQDRVRSDFRVGQVTSVAGGIQLKADGTVNQLRKSNQAIWRSHSQSTSIITNQVATPQIGGGAGWKGSGHIGYILSTDGQLWAWGDNRNQVVGPSSSLGNYVLQPTRVDLPAGESHVQKIASSGQGASIICAIFASGSVYCRGTPGGTNSGLMPAITGWVRAGLPSGVRGIDLMVNGYGSDSLCVLASDSQVYCAGDGWRGQLGNGTRDTFDLRSMRRFAIPAGQQAREAVIQDERACVITTSGRAYCAGNNGHGQLGIGAVSNPWEVPTPTQVAITESIVDIRMTYHASGRATYFLTASGNLYGSGSNEYGTMNDSGSSSNQYPTPRLLRSGVATIISIGEEGNNKNSLCAIDRVPASGQSGLWCMGDNQFGQISGTCGTQRKTWTQISLGGAQASPTSTVNGKYQMNSLMVITTSGQVYAAGDNTYGKLGTTHPRQACNGAFRPLQLPAETVVQDISNLDEYSAAVMTSNGTVHSSGRNHVGQLGIGSTTDASRPTLVPIPRTSVIF